MGMASQMVRRLASWLTKLRASLSRQRLSTRMGPQGCSMVNTWLNKNSQRAWIREWREGRVQEGRYVDTSHHLAEDQAIRGSNDKSGISCDGTGAMIAAMMARMRCMWNGWAMQRRARTTNSFRMSNSQVIKYINSAESKTKIHNGNGLSATSIKVTKKCINAPIEQEKYC